jgi:hypothetical protein
MRFHEGGYADSSRRATDLCRPTSIILNGDAPRRVARAALIAGTPWLDVFCGTSGAIDLRTLDRRPLASASTLMLGLR